MDNKDFDEIEDIIDDESSDFKVEEQTESSVPLYEAPTVEVEPTQEDYNDEEPMEPEVESTPEYVEPAKEYVQPEVQPVESTIPSVEPLPNYEEVEEQATPNMEFNKEVNENPTAKVELNNEVEEEKEEKVELNNIIQENVVKNKSLVFSFIIGIIILAAIIVLPKLISSFIY